MYGKMIRELRNKMKMSQRDFAAYMEISRSTLALYELEKREPSFDMLKKLVDVFKVSYDYLLTGVETNQRTVHDVTGLSGVALKQLSIMQDDSNALDFISAFIAWGGTDTVSFHELIESYQKLSLLGLCLANPRELERFQLDDASAVKRFISQCELRKYTINGVLRGCYPALERFYWSIVKEPINENLDALDARIQEYETEDQNGGVTDGTPEET